jgi:hypothetical protein
VPDGPIPFTNSSVDLSLGRGFQFKVHCRKCGNGYVSTFQINTLSTVASAAQSAQSLEQPQFSPNDERRAT